MKQNRVSDDVLRLYLFPYSLTHHATTWFDCIPKNSIHTFQEMALKFLSKYFPPSMVTKLRNDISNFRQLPDEFLFEAWERYKFSIDRCPTHNMLLVTQIDTFFNGLTLRHRDTINAAAGGTFMKRRPEECYDLIENMTAHHNYWDTSAQRGESSSSTTSSSEISCGGPHSYYECQAIGGYTQDVYATTGNYNSGGNVYQPPRNRNLLSYRSNNFLGPPDQDATNQLVQNQISQLTKALQERPQGVLPSNTVPNPREDIKVITTQSGITLAGPSVPSPPSSSSSKEVERDPETITDHVLNKEKLQDKSDIQIHSFLQMFKKLHFNISFPEALAYMPKYAKMVKDLLTNKEKLLELVNTPLNENCSAVLLKKLLEKLRDGGRFLIPCEFQEL
ncbi:reverse transcriptase domain-containing protein [Tanacetum coccineum]